MVKKEDPCDICPFCKSTRHSNTFEIRTGTAYNDDCDGNLKGYPTNTEFVFCGDCGIVRAYEYTIYSEHKRKYF